MAAPLPVHQTNQLLAGPLLNYQLLIQALLLPQLAPPIPNDAPHGESGATLPEMAEDDQLRLLSMANQLSITRLNQLVTNLVDNQTECETQEPPGLLEQEFLLKLLDVVTAGFQSTGDEIMTSRTTAAAEMEAAKEELERQRGVMGDVVRKVSANKKDLEQLLTLVTTLASNAHHFSEVKEQLGEAADLIRDLASPQTTEARRLEVRQEVQEAVLESTENITVYFSGLTNELSEDLTTSWEKELQALHAVAMKNTMVVEELRADVANLTEVLATMSTTLNNLVNAFPTPEPVCPSEYVEADGQCFYVSEPTEEANWLQARKTCLAAGGELAQPSDVMSLASRLQARYGKGLEGLWVGGDLHDTKTDGSPPRDDLSQSGVGRWTWLSGEEVSSQLFIRPAANPGEACLALTDQGLHSAFCWETRRFLCSFAFHVESSTAANTPTPESTTTTTPTTPATTTTSFSNTTEDHYDDFFEINTRSGTDY